MRTRNLTSIPALLALAASPPAQANPFDAPRAEVGLSAGTAAEADAALTFDKRAMVFASTRAGGAGGTDLWLATRPDPSADWATVTAMPGANMATPFDEWGPALDPTGTWLVFASNRPGGPGGGDLWQTTRATGGDPFAPPQLLAGVNTPFNETDAAVSTDCLEVVYVSDFPVGPPGRRLWRATRPSTAAPFVNAQPISELDGPGEEIGPTLSRDGLTILFSSDRAGGSGFDVWRATRPDHQSPFGAAQRVDELSTAGDDLGVALCFDDWSVYLTQTVAGTPRIVRADRSLPLVEDMGFDPELGFDWQVWTRAPQNSIAFLFLSPLAIPPIVVPGFGGALELDPSTVFLLHVGVCDASERSVANLPIPLDDNLIGLELHYQALVDGPADSLRKFSKRLKRAVRRLVDKLTNCVSDLRQCSTSCANQLPDLVRACARSQLYQLYWGPTAYGQAVAQCTQSAFTSCLEGCMWSFARCALR